MTDTLTQDAQEPVAVAPRSLWHRLYHGETTYDFIGRRKIGFTISIVLLTLTVVSLFGRGLNLGLDFKGGSVWDVPAKNGLTIDMAKSVLADNGIGATDAKVQTVNGSSGERVRVQTGVLDVAKQAKAAALHDLASQPARDSANQQENDNPDQIHFCLPQSRMPQLNCRPDCMI